MTQIFTEQFKQLPEIAQTKVKERFAALIKEDKEELDLSGCWLKGKEVRYDIVQKHNKIKKLNLSK